MRPECDPRSRSCVRASTAVIAIAMGLAMVFVFAGPLVAKADDRESSEKQKGPRMSDTP